MKNDILDEGFRKKSYQDEKEIQTLENENNQHRWNIAITRNLLLIFSGYLIFDAIFLHRTSYFQEVTIAENLLNENGLIVITFLITAIYSFRYPKTFFIIALVGFTAFCVFSFFIEWQNEGSFIKSTIFRIFMLYFLGKAVYASHILGKNKTRISHLRRE